MSDIEWLWLLVILVLSFGLTWFQYHKQFKKNKSRSLWYAIPRFLAYLCLGLLILNPKFKQVTYFNEKPDLIIGIDNSMSVGQLTDAENYKKRLKKFINNEELNKKFNIHPFSFGENYQTFDSLVFSEPQTNISNFINQISKVFRNRNSHLLLFTDGQQTLGSDYIYTSKSLQKDIIPIIVGDTTNYVDTKIDRINSNSYAFLNNQFPVEFFVSSNSDKSVKTELVIRKNKKILSRKPINFSDENKVVNFTMYLKANTIGVNAYTAELQPIQEKNTQNNRQEFAVEIIDERTKILILYDKLHPDLGMLKESIESNPQRQVQLKSIKETLVNPGDFNLVILYQPDFSFKSTYDKLRDQSINHIVITGSQTNYNFLNRAQNHFLKSSSRATEDFYAEVNPGFNSYQLQDINFDLFPPLKDTFGDIELKSEADVLLFQNIDGYSTRQPLLMTVSEGRNQKTAYLFGENIWRWRMRSYIEEESFKEFDGFIDQLIQFVSSTQTKKRLVSDIKSFYNKGENNIVNVQYFDQNYSFDPNQKISLNMSDKETNKNYSYNLIIKNNNYSTKINDLPAGEYNYSIDVSGKNLAIKGEFKMIDFLLEKSFYRANVEKLRMLSDTVFYEDQLGALKNYLSSEQKFKPVQKSIEKRESLVNWWVLLALIVVFLSIEWFSRKYHGLI